MKEPTYIQIIRHELSRRLETNPRYSLRAFATAIDINAGTLSQVLAGKRHLTFSKALEIIPRLDLSPIEKQTFLNSLSKATKSRDLKRVSSAYKQFSSTEEPKEVSLDVFNLIAEWHHYAILDLPFVKGFKSDVGWIAKRLGITITEANMAIQRLCSLELMEWKDGELVKTHGPLTTADKALTNSALKRRQKQILGKSLASLENDPIDVRNHSGMTMAISSEKIPEAKKRIEAFLQEMSLFLEEGQQDRMYELTVNLFPLDHP
jgi:uncharacterized protein (TIGR02147 family)